MREHPIFELLRREYLTRAWLAKKTGVSPQYVHQIYRGDLPPSAKFRRRCAEVFGLPESALFSDVPTVREETASV